MSDSIIERLSHHAQDERNTAFARSTMREAELEIEQQRLSEEGAKEAFAHVVQQKRDLETECKRLGGLLDDAYKIVRQKERELAASREREARIGEALITARDHIDMAALEISHSNDAQVIRSAVRAALAEGAQR